MKKSEVKSIIREVIDELGGAQVCDFKNKPMLERGGHTGTLSENTVFSVPDVDGFEFPVEVEFDIYHGTNDSDDPSDITLEGIDVTENFKESDLGPDPITDPKEVRMISVIKTAVHILYPKTPQDVLVPKGADMMDVNDKVKGLLNPMIESLENQLFEKHGSRYHQ